MPTPDLIQVIDEQDDFLVLYKPANMSFHDEGDLGEGFFNQVKITNPTNELYPVHRLDKMTSGLIIVAKNLKAAQEFQTLFNEHKFEKYYLAISDKKPSKKQGLIKGDMKKSRRSAWKLLRSMENPAISQFFSYTIGNGRRIFLIKPHSGKTHQIRVALNSLGSPILGDVTYSGTPADRGYLHAYAMRFVLAGQHYEYQKHPQEGELFNDDMHINAEAPWTVPWQVSWPKVS